MVLIENVDALTSWLLKELKPICDAQPSDLATYVLSLIRKPDKTDDETREFCAAQLDIFLSGNTKRFVEKLFEVLKDGSYIEQKQSAPPAKKKEEEAIKEDKEESKPTREVKSDVRKTTSRREDSKKDELKVVVRRRISPPASELKKESSNRDRDVRRRSRSPRRGERRGDRRRSPERRQRRSRSRSRSGDRRKSGEKKRRCRDYDEKGYCTRGDACPYDHGSDPVVFDRDSMDLMGGIAKAPFNMSVPPPGYNPLNPPPPGVEGIYNAPNTGSNVEGYNPEAPALTTANYSVPPPPLPLQMTQAPWRPSSFSVNTVPGYDPSSGVPVDPSSGPIHTGPMRGGMRGRGRGRGGHQGGHFGGQNRGIGDGKTIHVSRIPQEQNNIAKLNEHFAQFGNISNIQVRFDGDPESALISFYCKAEATAAVKSPAPVLNNRFIRVNYYRPPEGENGSPNNADVATSLSSGIRVSKPNTAPVEKPKVATVGESKFVNTAFSAKEKAKIKKKELSSKAKSILEAHKKQTTLLESLLKQQKTILTKLKDESTDQETKKRLKDMAKSTSEQITVAKTLSTSLSRQLEENTAALKENQALLDELLKKGAEEEEADAVSRKRTAPLHQSSPIKKKATGTALLVTGFTLDDEQKVTEAMEAVGELLDIEIQPGASSEISAVYIYKDSDDAEKVLKSPPEVSGNVLKVSTTTNKLEEQPQPVQDLSSPIELEAAE